MTDKPDVTIFEESEKGYDVRLKEEELCNATKRARDFFSSLSDELEERGEDFTEGLSFLDLKNDTLLSYMIDICNIVLRKIRFEKIEGHKSVERCIEYRVILEKIKGIDQKLAYQLNKLITLPEDAQEEAKIDVRNLDIDIDQDDDEEEAAADDDDDYNGEDEDGADDDVEEEEEGDEEVDEEDEVSSDDDITSDKEDRDEEDEESLERRPRKQQKVGPYRPPKLRYVSYDKQDERQRPESYELNHKLEKERTRYEEENYTRLREPSKKKVKAKSKSRTKGKRRR